MKIAFAGILTLIFFSGCHKKSDTCNQTMADIAGQYKMTKLEQVSYATGMAQDVTSTLSLCQLSGIYTLVADSTISFSEPGNCTESGTGHWNIDNGNFIVMFNSGGGYLRLTYIVSWDCKTLVLMTRYPNVNTNDRITLTRL